MGHSIQKRDDEPTEPPAEPEEAPPTTIKPIKKKKKTEAPEDESEPTVKPIKKKKKPKPAAADSGRITIINKIGKIMIFIDLIIVVIMYTKNIATDLFLFEWMM